MHSSPLMQQQSGIPYLTQIGSHVGVLARGIGQATADVAADALQLLQPHMRSTCDEGAVSNFDGCGNQL